MQLWFTPLGYRECMMCSYRCRWRWGVWIILLWTKSVCITIPRNLSSFHEIFSDHFGPKPIDKVVLYIGFSFKSNFRHPNMCSQAQKVYMYFFHKSPLTESNAHYYKVVRSGWNKGRESTKRVSVPFPALSLISLCLYIFLSCLNYH